MTSGSNRRRLIVAGLAAVAVAAASAFLAFGPALAATPPAPVDASAGNPVPVPAIADPAVSGTDLVVWTGHTSIQIQIQMQKENQGKHDTLKNTIQNVR